MITRIPDLYQTAITLASFCVFLRSGQQRAIAWTDDKGPLDLDFEVGDPRHRISLKIRPPDKDQEIHFHVNLARLDALDLDVLPSQKGTLEQLQEVLEYFHGTDGQLAAFANYQVKSADVPAESLLRRLGGVSAKIGDLELSLTGAELSIKGGDYRKINWSQSGGWIRGSIWAAPSNVAISPEYLDSATKMLDDGVRRFILEKRQQGVGT